MANEKFIVFQVAKPNEIHKEYSVGVESNGKLIAEQRFYDEHIAELFLKHIEAKFPNVETKRK